MQGDPETMKCVLLGDTEIEYCERGAGEPLLLVHAGVFANWFVPMATSRALGGFRVIRVRRAGYGRNAPERPLTRRDHANHLVALVGHLGLEAVHLVGHSSSAQIGLNMASDHPQLVRSLILMEPAPCGPLQVPAAAELVLRPLEGIPFVTKLATGLLSIKLPVDLDPFPVNLPIPGAGFPPQPLQMGYSPVAEALSREDSDLDLRLIKPTAVFGCVVDGEAVPDFATHLLPIEVG